MALIRTHLTLLMTGVLMTGCSFASDALFGEDSNTARNRTAQAGTQSASSTGGQNQVNIPPSRAEANPQPTLSPAAAPPPALGQTNFVPPQVTPGPPTGTYVGQRVSELRGELQRLQSQINQQNGQLQGIRNLTEQHSRVYHSTVGAINARLQVGTTPGNPELVNQWNVAQTSLAQIENDIAQMNTLANGVAGTSTLSAYLLETTRAAYGLSGAVDEDHRQLAILEDEVNRTVVLIDRLLNELSEDIGRQNNYLAAERGNLTTLALAIKNGELLGTSLTNRAFESSAPPASSPLASRAPPPMAAPASTGGVRRPLVVIRFDRKNPQYEQALYAAVSQALERKPDAMFDLVAVAPNRGNAARVALSAAESKRNAETVLRSLSDMGLPLDRVRLSALSSNAAASTEVHLYVR